MPKVAQHAPQLAVRAAGEDNVVGQQDAGRGVHLPLVGGSPLSAGPVGDGAGYAADHGQLDGAGGVADIHVVAGRVISQVAEDLVAFPQGRRSRRRRSAAVTRYWQAGPRPGYRVRPPRWSRTPRRRSSAATARPESPVPMITVVVCSVPPVIGMLDTTVSSFEGVADAGILAVLSLRYPQSPVAIAGPGCSDTEHRRTSSASKTTEQIRPWIAQPQTFFPRLNCAFRIGRAKPGVDNLGLGPCACLLRTCRNRE